MSKSLGEEGVSINKSELATNLNGQLIFNEFVYMSRRALGSTMWVCTCASRKSFVRIFSCLLQCDVFCTTSLSVGFQFLH